MYVADVSTCKGNYCLYCEIKQRKLARHCTRFHSKETLVAEALAIPKEELKQRRRKWQHITNLGNHAHNIEVHQCEKQDLVVRKRPRDNRVGKHTVNDYVPCSQCLGYFHRLSLWKHKLSCPCVKDTHQFTNNPVRNGRLLIPTEFNVTFQVSNILQDMKRDQVSLIVRNDRDILQVGGHVFSKCNSVRRGG